MKLSSHQAKKIGGKTSLGVGVFGFVKFSISVMRLMPYYVKTGYSRLPPLNLGFNPEKPKDLS
jgi:hypothetical protein